MGKKLGGAGLSILGGVTGAVTSGIAANMSKKEAQRQQEEKERQQAALDALEASRPVLQNPYENMQNAFAELDNPYANLTVATQAFNMQAKAADQALANSFDVMMETGQAAGGATALAQMALESKQGIAASINAQESQNAKLAAEGAANVAKLKAQGQADLDKMKGEGDLAAQKDAINFHENKMDRTAKLLDNAAQNEQDARAARTAGIMGVGTSMVAGLSGAAKAQ